MDSIDRAFDLASLEKLETYAGYQLRDAELDSVAHYFEYNADRYAEAYLG